MKGTGFKPIKNMLIPFAKPTMSSFDSSAVKATVESGWITRGPKCQEFEVEFSKYVGCEFSSSVSSCTTAMHLALLAAGVRAGDIVLTVSHSFIATANAIRACGAEPGFIDIDDRTLNMDPDALAVFLAERCHQGNNGIYFKDVDAILTMPESPLHRIKPELTGRIAAVMPVHQLGLPCSIVEIADIAKNYNIPLIEDAACAVGSEIKIENIWRKIGQPFGQSACFSFHPRKVLTTGDGGMITTNSAAVHSSCDLGRQHGMSISDADRHKAQNVMFEEYLTTAFNYRLTDIQAALGLTQLKQLDSFIEHRCKASEIYYSELFNVSWLRLREIPKNSRSNWQSFPIWLNDHAPLKRDAFIQYLHAKGIGSRRGVMNAHQEKPYLKSPFSLPKSEKARAECVLLPIYSDIPLDHVRSVCEALKQL